MEILITFSSLVKEELGKTSLANFISEYGKIIMQWSQCTY